MRLFLVLFTFVVPSAVLAEAFQRPIPQPQTAEAELAYLAASLIFLAALIAVQWLVGRR
ncbi:MAG: protein NnrT [Pseudotabrizicola sp.]|uniref:protein NnrT n=1 Tax=Pseudotabrizicola sp. TaxID=2939647 RepID=UPI002717F2DC|nr:protein NnrT [Pseudotabrizicola sp.]MDO8884352.1 protein NnrT [Pseudotabrizicola sp.]MDP2080265.1 protein NnrT [Pseudotabrizicola sp.]MDZ7575350.1 protein NnrT [Pseudotabrizicola sp.]